MKAFHYTEVPQEGFEGLEGVSIRWVMGDNVQTPNFITRVIDLAPGANTPYHQHPWEHEAFVLDGSGTVRTPEGETELSERMCIYVPPNEEHQFLNTGDETLRFICIIPQVEQDA